MQPYSRQRGKNVEKKDNLFILPAYFGGLYKEIRRDSLKFRIIPPSYYYSRHFFLERERFMQEKTFGEFIATMALFGSMFSMVMWGLLQ